MINKETILSVYTEKQTLLEYLTKIETALDKAVLTSSQLVYEGGNNYHFKFVFEDGSSIETPSITLVQPISKVDFLANGNSVHFVFTLMDGETITTQTINLLKPVTAAAVRDGILYLTLSDGTEVNAGSVTASFGAATFNGDVDVDGNVTATGYIKPSKYELDQDLGLTLPEQETARGWSIKYQHARISNGILNIVIMVQLSHPSFVELPKLFAANFYIPESVGKKLYPALGSVLYANSDNSLKYADTGLLSGFGKVDNYLETIITKLSDTNLVIEGVGNVTQVDSENNFLWRTEVNFTL